MHKRRRIFVRYWSVEMIALPMLRLLLSNAQGRKMFEDHRNLVMWVFIGKLSLSTLK